MSILYIDVKTTQRSKTMTTATREPEPAAAKPETRRFSVADFGHMLDEGIVTPAEGAVLRDGRVLVPDGVPRPGPTVVSARDGLAAVRVVDGLTGLEATLLLPPGAEPPASVGALLDHCLLELAADDRLLVHGLTTEDGLLKLRQLADLCYLWDDAGQLPAGRNTGGLDGYGWRPGLDVWQGDGTVQPEDPVRWEAAHLVNRAIPLADLTVSRSGERYERNWNGFHARRWRHDPPAFDAFVRRALAEALAAAPDNHPPEPVAPDDPAVDNVLRLDTPDRVRLLIEAVSAAVWRAPFENYSRFAPGAPRFKTGDDTIRAIMAGDGGICTEKVQAVRFITDHFELPAEYVLAGPDASGPFPQERLRELLDTFDFRFARRHMRYWQHAALLYWLYGEPLLVDATNGNIPNLCVAGADALALLSQGRATGVPVKVRMMAETEDWHYHRVPQDIPRDLLQALEGWLDDADLVQVFDNELGLFLSERWFIAPLPWRSRREHSQVLEHYRIYCDRARFGLELDTDWRLDGKLGRAFTADCPRAAAGITAARERLAERYEWWQGPGFGMDLLVIERTPGLVSGATTR